MGRKKITLGYITGSAARNATMKKRRLGLLKKVKELSILCQVPACAIIYAPNETSPVVWPSPEAATDLLRHYNAGNGVSKAKHMTDQKKVLAKRMAELRAQIGRITSENDDLTGELLLHQCLVGRSTISDFDLHRLASVARAISCRADAINGTLLNKSTPPPPLLSPPEIEDQGFQLPEFQNRSFCMEPAKNESTLCSKEAIFMESELNSDELSPEMSDEDVAAMISELTMVIEPPVFGMTEEALPGWDIPEFGVSLELEEFGSRLENFYPPTCEELQNYLNMG